MRPMLLFITLILFATSGITAEVKELEWDDLMPKDWQPENPLDRLTPDEQMDLIDGSPEAQALMAEVRAIWDNAPVVEALDGAEVAIPGYVVPLEMGGQGGIREFLLVPYIGACIHVPPPPSNQVVFVRTAEPLLITGMFDAVVVTGKLATEVVSSDLAEVGYTLEASVIESY